MMRSVLAAAAALAGCAQTPAAGDAPPAASPAPAAGPCDAGRVQDLIGKPADAAVTDAQARSGARTVRRYVTGSAVTMDYREDRLNVETDTGGTIVRLTCG